MNNIGIKLGLVLIISLALYQCGGGGGDGTIGGVTYNGLTTPITVTAANADSLAAMAITAGSSGSSFASVRTIKSSEPAINFSGLARTLVDKSVLAVKAASASPATRVLVNVNKTVPCDVSGTVLGVGQIDDVTLYGSLTMTFKQCSNDGVTTMDGTVVVVVDATGMAMTFTRVTITDATGAIVMGGSIKVSGSSTYVVITMNFVASDSSGNQIKTVNFVDSATFNVLVQIVDESISGRVYDSAQGYLDISTTSPLVYSPAGSIYPSSGGPVVAMGAGNTAVRVTPVDQTSVLIEADTTGDGNYDYSHTVLWSAFLI